jgi:hypothetical protein
MNDAELKQALRAYRRRRPFRPYLLEFHSGAQVLVHHPDGIAKIKQLWLYRGPQRAQALFTSSSVGRLLDPPSAN